MRYIELERADPDGSRWHAILTPGARDILSAGCTHALDRSGYPPPPAFEATGLRCGDAYAIHVDDMPQVLWMLVDRLRRRRMRLAYRRRQH